MSDRGNISPRKGNGVAPRYSHLGVCVSDLERAMRFYREGLGFSEGVEIVSHDNLCHFVGVASPLKMISRFMSLGAMNIELLAFPQPGLAPSAALPKAMNQVGMTHLSFYVSDIDETAQRLEALGGRILHHTRNEDENFEGQGVSVAAIFCTDPDGTRIELMCFSENFPGFVPD